jgi:hypothetical protein
MKKVYPSVEIVFCDLCGKQAFGTQKIKSILLQKNENKIEVDICANGRTLDLCEGCRSRLSKAIEVCYPSLWSQIVSWWDRTFGRAAEYKRRQRERESYEFDQRLNALRGFYGG